MAVDNPTPTDARPQARLFPVQNVGLIPWSLAERAYARYAQLYGGRQTLERLAERGGFGLAELGFLLRGYERRSDSKEDDGDWHRACEYATKEILLAVRADALAALDQPAAPQLSIEAFRAEVRDKLYVVYHGAMGLQLTREIARQQCEDFLVNLFAAALDQTAPQEPWQPIETAPEDTVVLVHDEGYTGKGLLTTSGWLDTECGRDDAFFDPPPTHWLPLPAPPVVPPSGDNR